MAVSPNDADLCVELKAGKASAWTTLYELYGEVMYAFAFQILNNRQESEDLVQEIFLSLWRRCTYQPERGSLKTFLMLLVRSKALDRLRAQRSKTRTLHRSEHTLNAKESDIPFEYAVSDEVFLRVQAALKELPQKQRRTLEMSYFKGMTQLEISQSLNIPLGTVKSSVRLGFSKLRHSLEDLTSLPHQR